MTITMRTMFPQTVLWCLKETGFGAFRASEEGSILLLAFETDVEYRDMATWLAAALACGLIVRGEIDR